MNTSYPTFVHSSTLEIVWTLLPVYALFVISGPSFGLLYTVTELLETVMTIKCIGHQWYWSYELSNSIKNFYTSMEYQKYEEMNAYIVAPEDFRRFVGRTRLLETTENIFLPINTPIRMLFTSDDVLHSWAVPSFAVKTDVCPGRLSEISLNIHRLGAYSGQCSEICGINHGFMPIFCRATSLEWYKKYIKLVIYKMTELEKKIFLRKNLYFHPT